MDARQRLNQLRRFKSKLNRNKVIPNKKRLTDLRELIHRNDNKSIKINKNARNSVKTRIGFKNKNDNQTKKRLLIANKNKRRDKPKNTNKRVLLDNDQRLPTVVVDLSQIDDNPTLSSARPVASHSGMYSSGSHQKFNSKKETKNSILVSNLNQTITDSDIKELFGEIGPIVKSSKINNSVALIVYRNEVDARKACHTYHNRLLDGMPMQCNTLSLSDDEYAIETQPKRQTTNSRPNTSLLASQLRQINSMSPQLMRGQTFSKKRSNRSNVRFVVNV